MSTDIKKILGLDLGTNSIGWALIEQNFEKKYGKILGMGSRIIPMSQDILGKFDSGVSISQTAERTRLRSVRRLKERHLLRRERLHRVLNVLDILPKHYADKIDFDKRLGKFLPETETKFAYDNDNQFIFMKSFNEMLEDFRKNQPELVNRKNKRGEDAKVPYDWTIYYLRKKALSKKIENEELAWLILHFNQKRGYYQLRGEDTDDRQNKVEEFYSLKIVDVVADEPQKGKAEIWYSIILENGWVYRRASKQPLSDWKNKVRDFIVTTDLNDDGSIKIDKEGNEKRSFRSPKEDDWKLLKKKTETDIDKSEKTVGEYIYDTLLQKPDQKIRGNLVRTIERKYYKEELTWILEKQAELNPLLKDDKLYHKCIEELYPHNQNHQSMLANKDFLHLFIDDILFYQRPLRSQKGSISNCPLEFRTYIQEGVKKLHSLKCIPKSHPLYQEFRLWQWVINLRISNKETDLDETGKVLQTHEDYSSLFEFLNARKEVEQKPLIKYLLERTGLKGKLLTAEVENYRWNYVEDKKYPCNETHAMIKQRLDKVTGINEDFFTGEVETELWHILYSVTDKIDFEKALKTFARKHNVDIETFFEAFKKFPPFPSNYGSYSAKAIKKLLPLMRIGKYWYENKIDTKTKERIEKITTGEYDENIRDRVREKTIKLTELSHFQGLPEWLAKYVVYDRHAERSDTGKWKTVADLEDYLKTFRQHSLKNPIVEQILTEALRVVRDIWKHYGGGAENFFDEIHIELGREMKNPKGIREFISKQNTINENTNLRIKALLAEMLNDSAVENVRPYSPMQQEILKVYEDGVLKADIEIPDDIDKISRLAQPSSSELQRYKLWLEQKYRSPYTGDIIPLNKLFTPAYEIEHIIPQSRYFDDSFSNKIICESAVNKLKDHQTALEFIQNHHGQRVELGMGKTATIFSEDAYIRFVNENYSKNRGKKNKLMALDIPEKMIERQLNDTRYISKFVMQTLSNIVRQDLNDDGVNSKNILACNGQITSRLKQDWGLDAIWNEMILPRFERLNTLMNTTHFTIYNEKYQKYLPTVPLELQKGFQKKRIDHRHHAMDALVIACATRSHINYLNNMSGLDKKKSKDEKQRVRYDLKAMLCNKKYNDDSSDNYKWIFKLPWNSFVSDAKENLGNVIVSFKQNLRVINKAMNVHEKIISEKKEYCKQVKGSNWAIRKSLHKDTVSGRISLRKRKTVSLSSALNDYQSLTDKSLRTYIKTLIAKGFDNKKIVKHFKDCNNSIDGKDFSKVEIFYWDNDNVASRTDINTSFTKSKIGSIADDGIQKILLQHLERKDYNSELAFTPEGIEEMNRNIISLNNGKNRKPILKVRIYETKGNKFSVGQTGNKLHKYVEADKGTNLFYAVYQTVDGKRNFETIPLNEVIIHQQWRASLSQNEQVLTPLIPVNPDKGRLLFHLSPNDLVYIPNLEEYNRSKLVAENIQRERIYKIVSFTGNRLYAVPLSVATSIIDKIEFGQLNKLETTIDKVSIKDSCYKIHLDRIGKIKTIIN